MTSTWSVADLYALGVRTDLVTACDAVLGVGRTKAYELHDRGELPFPVLRAGNRLVVPVAPLLELLGLPPYPAVDGSSVAFSPSTTATRDEAPPASDASKINPDHRSDHLHDATAHAPSQPARLRHAG